MSRVKKGILLAVAVFGLLLFSGTLFVYSVLSSGKPVYSGEYRAAGVRGGAEVLFNARGVAHIYADSAYDLYFAQGFVHAGERLWQMEFHRRVVQGRLSEILGGDFIETDRFLRTIGLRRIGDRLVEKTSAAAMEILEAYADGVNSYIANQSKLPPEFRILGFSPELWSVRDSAGVLALMSYDLGLNWKEETIRLAMQKVLGERVNELIPPYEGWDPVPVWTPEQAAVSAAEPAGLYALLAAADLGKLGPLPKMGSNSWVVAPSRSGSGHAMLANDPHLSLSLPSIWIENQLVQSGRLDVYGWSIPGTPGVVIGHNETIAWGMTNVGDAQDLFLEKRHESDPYQFFYDGGWYRAEVIREEINVKGQKEPVGVEVLITRNGPLVSTDPAYSLRWTAYEIEASTIDAIMGMNRAQDWGSFLKALENFTVPIQNIVYADTRGNIGYRTGGLVPIRRQGEGTLPSPGWDPDYGWEGFIPMAGLPTLYNPPQGFIATANHNVTGSDYPYIISLDTSPPYRMMRITEVLGAGRSFTAADFQALQNDWYNRHAAERIPEWVGILKKQEGSLDEAGRRGLQLLAEWSENPVNRPEAAAPAIFQSWYLNLMDGVFRETMGDELYAEFLGSPYLAYNSLEYLLEKKDSPWLARGLDVLLLESYSRTILVLQKKLGKDPGKWQWQKLQTLSFNHTMGQNKLLRPLFSRGPFPYGGDHMTVGRAYYSLKEPFKVTGAGGLRFIALMKEGQIESYGILAGGQSGHPLSRHYTDQIQPWLNGEYFFLPITREALQETTRKMKFNP